MGELVMMFPTLRSFYGTKARRGPTLTELDVLYPRAAPHSPQRVPSLGWGSSPLIFSTKAHHPSHVLYMAL